MFIVDAHLDLAYNALRFDRNLRQSLDAIRQREAELVSRPNGIATVSLPELQRGGIGLVFASIFTMPERSNRTLPGNRVLTYRDPAGANYAGRLQLDYYHRLADELPFIRLVGNRAGLEQVVASHRPDNPTPLLGLVPLLEGADPITRPEQLEEWVARGLRVIGPAWDDTAYAAGAWREGGGFSKAGHHLLELMAHFGLILDLTHLSEKASLEALDQYPGPICATHCNARSLLAGAGPRHLSDQQIRLIAGRGGVIGTVIFNRFLKAGYDSGSPKESVSLADVVAHIDHNCQLLGNANHVGIGSDMDGGYGWADVPAGINSIADLPQIGTALAERGYSPDDITAIMGGNWLSFLRHTWKA